MKLLGFLQLLILIVFVNTTHFSQQIEGVNPIAGCSANYKIVYKGNINGKPDDYLLHVVLKPKYFTTACISDFVRQIKERFRLQNSVAVAIFDSTEDQRGWFHDYAISGTRIDRRRGNYIIDRKTGMDLIEFSREKGNPLNEVRIDFASKSEP